MSARIHKIALGTLWASIPVIAVLEIFAQWRIPRQDPPEESWKAAAKEIRAEKQENDLVVIAPEWATQGRLYLGDLVSRKDIGRFDTELYDRLFEVSLRGARAEESIGLKPESETEFDRLTLRRYKLPRRFEVIHDFLEKLPECTFEGRGKPAVETIVGYDFKTRLVIRIPLDEKLVTLTCPNVPLEGVLRGYGAVGYLSGRFDQGEPVLVSVFVDDAHLADVRIPNRGPNKPFELRLPGKMSGTVRFEVDGRDNPKREFGISVDVRRSKGAER